MTAPQDAWVLAFSPDGRWLGIGGNVHGIQIRRLPSGSLYEDIPTAPGTVDNITALSFSPDSRALLVGGSRVVLLSLPRA